MLEKIAELAEMAEEIAMDELEQFGFIAFEEGVAWDEWAEDESIEAVWDIAKCEYMPLELY